MTVGRGCNGVRRRSLRTLALFAGGVSVHLLLMPAARACDPLMAEGRVLFEATLDVRGREPVTRTFQAPASSEIMVLAREEGLDVTLEVTDAAGHSLGRADSPIRRTGIQRVELTIPARVPYSIKVVGKEDAEATGRADIKVVQLDGAQSSPCVKTHLLLAGADTSYAMGQAITHGLAPPGTTISAENAYKAAASGYREAIESLERAGSSTLLAQSQHAEAAVQYQDLRAWGESKQWAVAAARTYTGAHDDYGNARAKAIEAAALLEIAVSGSSESAAITPQRVSEMFAQARRIFASIAAFHERRGELHDQALALNNIGLSSYYEGRYDDAIRAYQRALPLYVTLRERGRQAIALQNIALAENEIGRFSVAIPQYAKVLELITREENPKLYALILGNSALANRESGNEDTALRQYGEVLTIARAIQDVPEQAVALNGIASVYDTIGDQERALEFYRQAIALHAPGAPRTQTASLRAVANVLRQRGDAEGALQMHREALALASEPPTRAGIIIQIARDLTALGRRDEASEQVEEILRQRFPGDNVARARALLERSQQRILAHELTSAEADLRQALLAFKSYESLTDEFAARVTLARLMRERGDSAKAFAAVDRAVALAEEVRLQSANPELRATLMQPMRPAFDLKISMLFEQYRHAEGDPRARDRIATAALAVAEQLRARALADFQNLDVTAPGLDPTLARRRLDIYRELAARRTRLETSLDRAGTNDARVTAIRSDIASLRQELDQIDARIAAASPASGAAAQHQGRGRSNVLGSRSVPEQVAIIEYWLGAEDTYAWTLTHEGISMDRLGASSDTINAAMALHTALRNFGSAPKTARLDAAETLYERVLGPLSARVSGKHILIFAPDGALHYVPFATLRSNEAGRKMFLAEEHDVAETPSVGMLLGGDSESARESYSRAGSAPGSRPSMLLVSDPVYGPSDPRVAGSSSKSTKDDSQVAQVRSTLPVLRDADAMSLPRLLGAAKEAAAIVSLLPPGSVDRLDGFGATRDQFLAASLERYRFIHVASHARTDAEIPQASALILSTVDQQGKKIDGRVFGADLMSVRLHAETVVLSACDTALGKSVAGEGLVGLRYVVLARGARSVISSLWRVSDEVTAELMERFYSSLLRSNLSVISAWGTASRAMLSSQPTDPGWWGAFTLTVSRIADVQPPCSTCGLAVH